MPLIYAFAEIHLDIAPASQQNVFALGISKSSPILRQVGRATEKPGFEVIQRREERKLARRRAVALLTALSRSARESPTRVSDDCGCGCN